MGEKRKPVLTILLKKPGKKTAKVELFTASDFVDKPWCSYWRNRYRIRSNGKWFGSKGKSRKKTFFTWYQFRDILWRSISRP